MIFCISRRRIDCPCTPIAVSLRTIQSPPNVRSRTGFSQRPAMLQGVIDGGTNVLVGVIGHWTPFALVASIHIQLYHRWHACSGDVSPANAATIELVSALVNFSRYEPGRLVPSRRQVCETAQIAGTNEVDARKTSAGDAFASIQVFGLSQPHCLSPTLTRRGRGGRKLRFRIRGVSNFKQGQLFRHSFGC